MSEMDDRLEHLISRRLDGELTEAQEHELNKWLVRDPEARCLLDLYEQQDAAVGAALEAALGRAPHSVSADGLNVAGFAPPRRFRQWLWPTAAAAAVLLVFSVSLRLLPWSADRPGTSQPGLTPSGPVVVSPSSDGDPAEPTLVEWTDVDALREHRRDRSRDVFGVLGPDGRTLYLLEMNRTQTTVLPVSGSF